MKVTEDLNKLTTTQNRLSKALGLSAARVNQLIQEGVVVRDESDPSGGVFVLRSIKNWYESKQNNGSEGDYWREHGLHERAKRQRAELQLSKEQGRTYDASVVERVMIEQLVGLRTHLLSLGSKLAPQLEGKTAEEIAALIDREVVERLAELSEYKSELFVLEEKETE